MERTTLLARLAEQILSLTVHHPVRVAVDGPDAAGKTTLADELGEVLRSSGRQVIRASIDRFHNPREVRYRQGANSPTGYYQDSFDLAALRRLLLDPLGLPGSPSVQTALFDFQTNAPLQPGQSSIEAGENAVLVFDGIFLLRPELVSAWDYSIFVQVDFSTVLARAEQRDLSLFGSRQAVRDRYLNRYLPAQQFYLSRVRPDLQADAVVINDHPQHPDLRFRPPES